MNNKTLKKKKSCWGWKSLRKKLLEKRKVARKVAGIKLLDSPRTDNIPKSLINLTLDTCTRKRSFFSSLPGLQKNALGCQDQKVRVTWELSTDTLFLLGSTWRIQRRRTAKWFNWLLRIASITRWLHYERIHRYDYSKHFTRIFFLSCTLKQRFLSHSTFTNDQSQL